MRSPESFHIVVTDINHHIRDFLQRELEKEGYGVCSIKTGALVYERIFNSETLDLIVLDPELLNYYDQTFIGEIIRRHAPLQVIIHTYADSIVKIKPGSNIHLVEKNGHSISSIKNIIRNCFQGYQQPHKS